jgi:hypothetical protein
MVGGLPLGLPLDLTIVQLCSAKKERKKEKTDCARIEDNMQEKDMRRPEASFIRCACRYKEPFI